MTLVDFECIGPDGHKTLKRTAPRFIHAVWTEPRSVDKTHPESDPTAKFWTQMECAFVSIGEGHWWVRYSKDAVQYLEDFLKRCDEADQAFALAASKAALLNAALPSLGGPLHPGTPDRDMLRMHGFPLEADAYRVPVESSNVRSAGWHDGTLEIEFHSGAIYQHKGISRELFDEFMCFPSKGSFYSRFIKGVYPTTTVKGGDHGRGNTANT